MGTHDDMKVVRMQPSDARVPGFVRASGTSQNHYAQARMVGWYDPGQLASTGIAIAISKAFGRNADRRLLEALDDEPREYFDYTADDTGAPRRELWIDYVADAGDGFDSTYAVASAVARDRLAVVDPTGASHATERGRILIFGGDLVYPVASREQYERRLVMPYEHALPHSTEPHPDVYAIPGNHDWYDSLIAFTRRFCSRRWFAGWRTHQRASYFALALPHDWWLIGTDVQLDSDIDAEQVRYFRAIAAQMSPTARIVLCTAEPHWIYQHTGGESDGRFVDSNLRFLEDIVFRRRISLFVAGDLHHYRRHGDERDHHKIVAGGGGAFLHPTHVDAIDALPGGYRLRNSYPDVATSRALTWRNLLFPILNMRFGLITALLYLVTCHAVQVDLSRFGIGDIAAALGAVATAALSGSTAVFWISAAVAGVALFTDHGPPRYRVIAGGAHALAHLSAVFFLGWAASWLVGDWHMRPPWRLLAEAAMIFAAAWLVGSLIVGGYLFVSLNCLGRHGNEAFSSLAIPDWKNFLRLHIDATGALRILPIGIDRVPRRWQPASHGARLAPDDPRATPPRLIEPPIVLPARPIAAEGAP